MRPSSPQSYSQNRPGDLACIPVRSFRFNVFDMFSMRTGQHYNLRPEKIVRPYQRRSRALLDPLIRS